MPDFQGVGWGVEITRFNEEIQAPFTSGFKLRCMFRRKLKGGLRDRFAVQAGVGQAVGQNPETEGLVRVDGKGELLSQTPSKADGLATLPYRERVHPLQFWWGHLWLWWCFQPTGTQQQAHENPRQPQGPVSTRLPDPPD